MNYNKKQMELEKLCRIQILERHPELREASIIGCNPFDTSHHFRFKICRDGIEYNIEVRYDIFPSDINPYGLVCHFYVKF